MHGQVLFCDLARSNALDWSSVTISIWCLLTDHVPDIALNRTGNYSLHLNLSHVALCEVLPRICDQKSILILTSKVFIQRLIVLRCYRP